jgi:hypothetical protein
MSGADVQGMNLDPQASEPSGFQNPRSVSTEPATDEQDPATPGGPSPFNGADPFSQPVSTDPMWEDPSNPTKKKPYSPTPSTGPGPDVDTPTLHSARRAPMEETMTIDLWVEASRDLDADMEHERMVRAKVAASAVWPFLSAAATEREFGHRLALCEGQLVTLFPEQDFRSRVASALQRDYLIFKGAAVEDLWADFTKTAAEESEPGEAQATGSPSNPYYFSGGPEAGPNTASDGQFAQFPAGPDPVDPMNGMFPMQPGTWTVPPNAAWVDRPMQLGAHQGSAGYVDEGVQTGPGPNPDYFAGGSAGVAGDQQNGFPADVSLPEPDERVDMYGTVQPQQSMGAAPVSYSNSPKQASRWVVAERDNFGSCMADGCKGPVYRDGDTWKHLNGDPGHGVRLHQDHPWLVAEQGKRTLAGRTASRRVADVSSSGDVGGNQATADPSGAPAAPPSMDAGGPGAEAGSPLTIPNDSASTNPFASGGGGGGSMPGGTGQAAGGMAPMQNSYQASRWVVADVRERPTNENPGGVADEYDANTWDAAAKQRPLQNAEDRRANGPQRPARPIPIQTSDGSGQGREEDDEDDEEGRR